MVSRWQVVLGFAMTAVQLSLSAYSQPSTIPRVGYLSSEPVTAPGTASELAKRLEGLRQGLRDLGYIEGRSIIIEVRRADGNYDRLPELAAELVRLKVDLLVAEGTKAAIAAKHATALIPIVVPSTADPELSG